MTAPDPHAWPETVAPERIEAASFAGWRLGLEGGVLPRGCGDDAETRAFAAGNRQGLEDREEMAE